MMYFVFVKGIIVTLLLSHCHWMIWVEHLWIEIFPPDSWSISAHFWELELFICIISEIDVSLGKFFVVILSSMYAISEFWYLIVLFGLMESRCVSFCSYVFIFSDSRASQEGPAILFPFPIPVHRIILFLLIVFLDKPLFVVILWVVLREFIENWMPISLGSPQPCQSYCYHVRGHYVEEIGGIVLNYVRIRLGYVEVIIE